jgi:hypothetical protein
MRRRAGTRTSRAAGAGREALGRAHATGRDGIALPAVLLLMLALGSLAVAGHFAALYAVRAARATLDAHGALYAAESGWTIARAAWPDRWLGLKPGAIWASDPQALPSGDVAYAAVERTDDGSTPHRASFLVHGYGRARNGNAGRHVAIAAAVRWPHRLCCDAAVTALRRFDAPNLEAIGHNPDAQSPCAQDSARPRVRVGPDAIVSTGGADGESTATAIAVDSSLAEVTPWDDLGAGLDDRTLAAAALHRWTGDTRLTDIRPRTNTQGACDTADPRNWGAPDRPDHPCHAHRPALHAAGNLTVTGPGAGQGLLLVDGDLHLADGFAFHGVAVVRGRATLSTAASVHGHIAAAEILLDDDARVHTAPCTVRQTLAKTGAVRPAPLPDRPWVELDS